MKATKNSVIPADQWMWFGKSGHFICGEWCRFHLCTRVGEYLISTVGEYIHPSRSAGSELAEHEWLRNNYPGEDIGCGRKYETMVFKAGTPCDAEGCHCGMPSISGHELDFRGYNDARSATDGHLALCKKWAKKGGAK